MDRGEPGGLQTIELQSRTGLSNFHSFKIAGLFGEMRPPHTDSELSQKAGVPRM